MVKNPTDSLPTVFFWLQGLKKVLKPFSVGSKQKGILYACKCSRKYVICFSNMTQLYGTLLASRRTHTHMTSWGWRLAVESNIWTEWKSSLCKIRIEINSERALMGLGKSLPHTFSLTRRAGEGKMRKIYVYAPERGEWPRWHPSPAKYCTFIGSASRISLLHYSLSENEILRIKEGSDSKGNWIGWKRLQGQ